MVATTPTAFAAAAAAPAGSAVQTSADLQQTAFRADTPRGDYARGYDEGRQQGVPDGPHDANVDCQKHKKMSPRDTSEYQRGWEAGYNAGYEFGYNKTYNEKCKAGSSRWSLTNTVAPLLSTM
jgi:hypothetical protein